jgi:hypothetical protein
VKEREAILSTLRNLALDRAAVAMMREDIARVEEDAKRKELPAVQREALKKESVKLQSRLVATVNHIRSVERLLELLSPEEQKVIDRTLINPTVNAVFDLVEELHCETASVYRIRARAISKLVRLRYGARE